MNVASRVVAETTPANWTVLIPVKGSTDAKSRFGGAPHARTALAHAMALDTVAAALAAPRVNSVLVVTGSPQSADFAELGAEVLPEIPGQGLNTAIMLGLRGAGHGNVAILLGDIPALDPAELEAALSAAEAFPLACVPDADGEGTVLVTALAGVTHAPAFGHGSRAAHLAAGYVELDVASSSGLRRDVDTAVQLAALSANALGARTAAVLAERAVRSVD